MPALSEVLRDVELASLGRVAGRAAAAFIHINAWHWAAMFRRHVIGGKWSDRSFQDLIGCWGAGLTWIMGMEIVKRNERQGPVGDLIIANHMGFMDIPVLLTVYPAVFVITSAYAKFPYFGPALAQHGHIFVDPKDPESRRKARQGIREALERGDRVIVFPEGRSSPTAERRPFKPFSFSEAQRQGKWVEACIVDYEPDRREYAWDRNRSIPNQILRLFGRKKILVSVEFLPSELVDDPQEMAQRYHDEIQRRLEAHDEARERGEGFDFERAPRISVLEQTLKYLRQWECWEHRTAPPTPSAARA